MADRVTCGECRFWGSGICRRRSPSVVVVPHQPGAHGTEIETRWPETFKGEWCGEAEEIPVTINVVTSGKGSQEDPTHG